MTYLPQWEFKEERRRDERGGAERELLSEQERMEGDAMVEGDSEGERNKEEDWTVEWHVKQ